MTLGVTNGTTNAGMNSNNLYGLMPYTGFYGKQLEGIEQDAGSLFTSQKIGIALDSSKSGIVADTSSLTLICNMIIKF